LLSIIVIIIDIAILIFGLILANKKEIINFTFGASLLLIIFSVLYKLNEDIEIWRNKDKLNIKNNTIGHTSDLDIKKIYYKNGELFYDGEFIFEKSLRIKVRIQNITNISIRNLNNFDIVFNKKDGGTSSMTVLRSEFTEDCDGEIEKLIDSVNNKKYKV
jgi:hypothetical protein